MGGTGPRGPFPFIVLGGYPFIEGPLRGGGGPPIEGALLPGLMPPLPIGPGIGPFIGPRGPGPETMRPFGAPIAGEGATECCGRV